jgi:hypothetical protein
MTILVGLNGYARSGKDTFAEIASNAFPCASLSFAEPMRRFVCELMDIPRSELDSIKEEPCMLFGGNTPRYVLQTMGTEWGRGMISDTLWVDVTMNKAKSMIDRNIVDVVFVTDVRFENEAKAIKDAGGIIISVERPDVKISESGHASEAGIPDEYKGIVLLNNGSLAEYKRQVLKTVELLLR